MRIRAQASSSDGITSTLLINAGDGWAKLNLDAEHLYNVPAEELADFVHAVLDLTTFPPDLPANDWATPQARSRGSAFLRDDERFQLLTSAVHLASRLPEAALFGDEPFDTLAAATRYFGRRFTDSRGNFLHVPSATIQTHLLNEKRFSREMCAVGYLFGLEVEDAHGNLTRFFYRPYNTGFATSSRWPRELQEIREQIEQERHGGR